MNAQNPSSVSKSEELKQLEETLRIAANQFYLNKYMDRPRMLDRVYDSLVKEYEATTGRSVKSLVEWEDNLSTENMPEKPLEKIICKDNNFQANIEDFMASQEMVSPDSVVINTRTGHQVIKYYLTPKYDGCGIKLIYDQGVLTHVKSTPDEKFGIERLESFWDIVPHRIPNKNVTAIRCEVLVDATKYGELSRNKANGLTNSKYKSEEINSECRLRAYGITFNTEMTEAEHYFAEYNFLHDECPTIELNGVKVFAPRHILHLDRLPNKPIHKFDDGDTYQVDGVVLYSAIGTKAFKFYYTESSITKVTDIIWEALPNGSYSAVLAIDPVTMNGRTNSKVNSGGINNMLGKSDNSPGQMGIGAKVRVIFANTTIPKIIEVIEPSDNFTWPTCECGYKMGPNDVFGSTLKCCNTGICSSRVKMWLPEVIKWILEEKAAWGEVTEVRQAISRAPEWFGYLFHIDRWDPYDKCKLTDVDRMNGLQTWSQFLMNCEFGVTEELLAACDEWFNSLYKYTHLQWNNYHINRASALEVLRQILMMNTFEKLNSYLNEMG